MNWINIKRQDWIALECTNPFIGIHVVRFSPTTIDNAENEQSEEDTKVIPIRYNNNPSVDEVKSDAINNIIEYDKSYYVNNFTYNGDSYWFDKQERLALLNSFKIAKDESEDTVTLWLGYNNIIMTPDEAIEFITNLEKYAIACNNVTKEHIATVHSYNTIEEIAEFDITKDYPAKIELIINNQL